MDLVVDEKTQQLPPVSEARCSPTRKRKRRAPARGAPENCFACARRGIKCDRRRPYCGQCLDVGDECSGYKTQLTWDVGVASRGKLKGLSLPIVESPPALRGVMAKRHRLASRLAPDTSPALSDGRQDSPSPHIVPGKATAPIHTSVGNSTPSPQPPPLPMTPAQSAPLCFQTPTPTLQSDNNNSPPSAATAQLLWDAFLFPAVAPCGRSSARPLSMNSHNNTFVPSFCSPSDVNFLLPNTSFNPEISNGMTFVDNPVYLYNGTHAACTSSLALQSPASAVGMYTVPTTLPWPDFAFASMGGMDPSFGWTSSADGGLAIRSGQQNLQTYEGLGDWGYAFHAATT